MNAPSIELKQETEGAGMSRGLVLLLAAATGLSVGTQYYNQPLLGLIADGFGIGTKVSLVAIATQIGYALGLVLLVPLGDKIDRRRLILIQCIGLTVATLCASAAPELYSLAMASIMIGVFATIAQHIIPLASELSPPSSRERVLASITSALLVGVLLARVISGFVGAYFSWRAMFLLGAVLSLMMLAGLAAKLPTSQPQSRASYIELLVSLFGVVRDGAELRQAALVQSLVFFGFSAFWTILTLLLQGPGFGLNSGTAGLFGVVALGGVMLAPLGLRLAGQYAGHVGIGLVVASFVVMIAFVNLVGLSVGAILMTTGLQMSLIYNQSRILALAGTARGRFNTIFMASQFAFGAIGSAAGSIGWQSGGWTAVMAMALIASAAALLVQFTHHSKVGARA
ncbi:MFS transporter [Pseudomonas veronii]|jgi:predicted MFS family arabinose efflux permease|nr:MULTISPECIES: MFS transporter [Pseudomonas]SEB33503.1 Predicted arabinose efflux permease, MFS family [Pseudomonas marginalis]KRP75851.1 permease [Pseudomonas veronii]MDY7549474.1 MFS transporter [Pseudomonas sp. FG1]MEB0052083.1 MFS transporter [Pseudomonas sp. FG1]NWC57435.1 MFS transporter [Pseudomonas veronii]